MSQCGYLAGRFSQSYSAAKCCSNSDTTYSLQVKTCFKSASRVLQSKWIFLCHSSLNMFLYNSAVNTLFFAIITCMYDGLIVLFLSFPKFPSFFSFGMFSKSGPTTKQVTRTLNEFIALINLCTLRLIESFPGKLVKCLSQERRLSVRSSETKRKEIYESEWVRFCCRSLWKPVFLIINTWKMMNRKQSAKDKTVACFCSQLFTLVNRQQGGTILIQFRTSSSFLYFKFCWAANQRLKSKVWREGVNAALVTSVEEIWCHVFTNTDKLKISKCTIVGLILIGPVDIVRPNKRRMVNEIKRQRDF